MAGGQCLDIAAEGASLSLSELQTLHGAKTGALIRVAVQLGALCGARAPSDEEMLLLTEYGNRIGLAFQVMDDVLDVTASSETLGKPAGSDEHKDKSTFPKLMGIEQARQLADTLVTEAESILVRTKLNTQLLGQLTRLVVDRSH